MPLHKSRLLLVTLCPRGADVIYWNDDDANGEKHTRFDTYHYARGHDNDLAPPYSNVKGCGLLAM